MNGQLAVRLLCCVMLMHTAAVGVVQDRAYTWTSSDGRYSVEATLVDSEYDQDQRTTHLVLRKANGTLVRVPLDRLSTDSRQLAVQILAARRSSDRREERQKRYEAGRREKSRRDSKKRALPPLSRPTRLAVIVDGVARSALVYPGVKAHAVPSPVLIYFHGFTGTSENSARQRRFHDLWPDATVVYPQGLSDIVDGQGKTGPGWKDARHGPWKGENREIQFVDALLAELSGRCRIDSGRIYASGHSNGGFVTFLLLLRRPTVFAAFAPVGCYGLCVKEARTPRPVFYMFGRRDDVFDHDKSNIDGSELAKRTLDNLLALNGCNDQDTTLLPNGLQMFRPKSGGQPVIWHLYDGDHSWPDSTNERVLRFFQQHALDAEDPGR